MGLIGRQEVRADNAPDFLWSGKVLIGRTLTPIFYKYITRTNIFNLSGTP